jgi:hypothetical protein
MLAIRSDGTVYVIWGYAMTEAALSAVSPDGNVAWSTHTLTGPPAGIEIAADGTIEAPEVTYGSQEVVIDYIDPAGETLAFDGPFLRSGAISPPALGPGGDLFLMRAAGDGYPSHIAAFKPGGTIEEWSAPVSALATDPYDNELLWPIVRDDGTVLFSDQGGVRAFSPQGSMSWQASRTGGMLAAAPDGTVYATTTSPNGVAAIRTDGTVGWQWAPASGTTGIDRLIVDGRGTVYVGTSSGIVAIASDGMQLWETSAAAMPVAIDGAGTLYALDASGSVLSALR